MSVKNLLRFARAFKDFNVIVRQMGMDLVLELLFWFELVRFLRMVLPH
jgi:hypothetical protein